MIWEKKFNEGAAVSFLQRFTSKILLAACLTSAWAVCAAENASGSFREAHTKAVRAAILEPGGVFGFFEPGEAVTFRLIIDGTAKTYEYTLTVKTDTGEVVFSQERTPLTGQITIPGQVRGYYSAVSNIYADGVKAYTIQGGFAVAPVPGKRDPFFLLGRGVIPALREGYKRIGCGAIQLLAQVFNKPEDIEVVKAACIRRFMPYAESGDFELFASTGLGGLWKKNFRSREEIEAGYPMLNDHWLKQYLDFLAFTQSKFKVKGWFIGFETPSVATRKEKAGTWSEAMSIFVTLVRMGSRQLKKMDPEVKIYAGGNNILEKTDDIEPIEMGDIVKDFDYYYIDGYTGNRDLARARVQIPEVDLMKFYRKASALSVSLGKGKYIVNNETGYAIPFGAPFDRGLALTQARLTARSIIISRAAPVLYYQLHTPNTHDTIRTEPADGDQHMNTIWKCPVMKREFHYVPLPGAAMYATAASELAFVRFEQEIIQGSVYSYVFTRPDGSTIVTLWNIEKEQPFEWSLPEGSTVLNMYGRDVTGKPLIISPDPVYITIPGPAAGNIKAVKAAIEANTPEVLCTALPDRVYVKSLIRETREGEIRMPGQAAVKVKIQPARVNAFEISASGPGRLVIGPREYEIPLEQVQTIKLKRFSDFESLRKSEPGILHYPDHIRPLEALHPERCYFKTPDYNPEGHNVSAKYWAGYDDKNFYLTAEVDDPVHIQRKTGQELWRDDCLQFVLSSADYPPSSMLTHEKKPASEYSFGLALTSKGPQLVKFLGKDAGIKTDYPANVVRKGDTTVYEVAIPWSALGGRAKRFGFLVWDNNSVNNPRAPYRLEFSPGIADGADSSKLAKVEYE